MSIKKQFNKKNKAALLFLFAILLISLSVHHFYYQRILSFKNFPENDALSSIVKIDNIEIERLGIDLHVQESTIKNGVWQISSTGASHLHSSATPGGGGNIVIYAHNKRSLFGPILWAQKGDEIIISANGSEYKYIVTGTETVSPDNLEPVLPKKEEILTLYTCTGIFDSRRFIVYAQPSNN